VALVVACARKGAARMGTPTTNQALEINGTFLSALRDVESKVSPGYGKAKAPTTLSTHFPEMHGTS
jgi:hypothetical protein